MSYSRHSQSSYCPRSSTPCCPTRCRAQCFSPSLSSTRPRVPLNSIPTRLGSALSQSKSTALQSLPSCSRRPQPSQSVIVLSSQFHSLLPHSLSCTVFLALSFPNSAPRFSQFNLYSASSSARWRSFLRTALAAPRPVAPSRGIFRNSSPRGPRLPEL